MFFNYVVLLSCRLTIEHNKHTTMLILSQFFLLNNNIFFSARAPPWAIVSHWPLTIILFGGYFYAEIYG
jgi:hypothetical protein